MLLHGDIGFHNFVVDGGRLSAVVDWEFAHIGDPAEDVAYIRNTSGGSIDWGAFMSAYHEAGGPEIDAARLLFFQVWGQLRNFIAAKLVTTAFYTGEITDIKIAHVGHTMAPLYLDAILTLIGGDPLG